MKILIVDDEEKLREVIKEYAISEGYQTDTAENGLVALEKLKTNNYDILILDIIDSGKGIKDEDINYIWDRYYKNKKKHKRNVIGTGLGLSIVKNILEEHKYEYGVKSKINKGTCFYFKINKNL